MGTHVSDLTSDLVDVFRAAGSLYSRNPGLLVAAVLPGGRRAIQEAIAAEAEWTRLCAVLPPADHETADREVRRLMHLPWGGLSRVDACRVVFRRWASGQNISEAP